MCRAKPYPRCSDHALKTLQKALQRHEEEATPESSQAVKEAQQTYLLTPAGEMMLRKQKLNELADKSKKERKRLNAEAKRFLKYSTAVEKLDPAWMGDRKLIPDLTNPTIAKAYALAVSCHSGVKRKSGEPYVNHPLRTAKHLSRLGYDEDVVAVALLHDTVEDSELTLDDLRRHGFNESIVSAVDSVSKRLGEIYPEAVARASQHPIGRLVKLADNLDNSSEQQLKPFDEVKKQKQIRKYAPARRTLILAIYKAGSRELKTA